MDGNRRWAREQGYANPSIGHLHGGEHLETVLGWCADFGIRYVTVFVASSDNLRKRGSEETAFLMEVVERVVVGRGRPLVAHQLHAGRDVRRGEPGGRRRVRAGQTAPAAGVRAVRDLAAGAPACQRHGRGHRVLPTTRPRRPG
ncbi:hypothetical protein CNX65_22715 [Actinosynnema pretiosum]|uniref:Undecaprenyl diphosphate synthase n=1 Tax=Actinosynnema pretiosum TaxID=42197 RepID=A0A290ZH58_9PSEU|nr:hypothetical protein CNX65_22715 [Actinosynnema pretiosum]